MQSLQLVKGENMKFQKIGKVNPDKKYKIKPMEFADNSMLKRLNYLLGFIKERNSESLLNYVDQLSTTIKSLIDSSKASKLKLDVSEKVTKFTNLKEFEDLVGLHYDFLFKILDLSKDEITTEEFDVPSRNYWLMVFGIHYYQLLALTEVIEREEAIELFKEYIDEYYVFIKSSFTKFETLEEMRKDNIKETESDDDPEFDVVASTVENGVYIIRNNNCPAVEALEDYEDKELVYVTCCYGDFQYAKMSNEHFVMTRDYTIAQGDPYCDKVFHDTRIDKEIKHPTKEFLDNMGPIMKKNE